MNLYFIFNLLKCHLNSLLKYKVCKTIMNSFHSANQTEDLMLIIQMIYKKSMIQICRNKKANEKKYS